MTKEALVWVRGLRYPAYVALVIYLFFFLFWTPKTMWENKNAEVHTLKTEIARMKTALPPGVDPSIVTRPFVTETDMEEKRIVGKTIFVSQIPLSLRLLRTRQQGIGPSVYRISNTTFEDCHFIGPGVVTLLGDTIFDGGRIDIPSGATFDSILLLMQNRYLFGAVPFADCGFHNCRFSNVAFAGTEQMLNDLRKEFQK